MFKMSGETKNQNAEGWPDICQKILLYSDVGMINAKVGNFPETLFLSARSGYPKL